ncbi:MAG TPA: preprotein translocase subunit SecE [Thermoleophilia bacterium]|nr:preprotein translocase subunit SecE [Thermoleophilia bacterium]HQG55056.1 preprotein translocase subunit SecE [Thermoleophilia bacterium]
MAKAVKNTSKPQKGARGATDKGKTRGKAPATDKGKTRGKAPAKQGRASARARAAQARPAAKGEKRGVTKFFRDVRVEMGKVTWPTRQDLLQSTVVVLVALAIAAAFTGLCDLVFSQFVEQILNLIT